MSRIYINNRDADANSAVDRSHELGGLGDDTRPVEVNASRESSSHPSIIEVGPPIAPPTVTVL